MTGNKKAFGTLLAALSVAALTACGGSGEPCGLGDDSMCYGPYELTIVVTGKGNVSAIASSGVPGALRNCTGTCSADFGPDTTYGVKVNLTATPDDGYAFVGWGGDCARGGAALKTSITMTHKDSCTAEFTTVPNR